MSEAKTESGPGPEAPVVVDRGWWLAVEYGVLPGRDRFLRKLPKLRGYGQMKELLEPGGNIVYRNFFRQDQVKAAWQLLCELAPWKQHLRVFVNGVAVDVKEAQDVVWCAGHLAKERPCRPRVDGKKGATWLVGCDRRISLAPTAWEEADPLKRHALTFARLDERGVLRFDQDAIKAFYAGSERARTCPNSPARDPARIAAAFADTSVRALGWPLVLEMQDALRKQLGARTLEAEHGFVLKRGQKELEEHEAIEVRATSSGEVEVRRASDLRGPSIARLVRLPKKVNEVLAEGVRLRGVRIEEGYVKGPDGRYEVEEKFVLSTRFHLGPADDPTRYRGFATSTVPRPTPEWLVWARSVAEELP